MNKMSAHGEVIHCLEYYLCGIRTTCSHDYYRKRREKVLEATREVVDAVSYKALVKLIEEMEAQS